MMYRKCFFCNSRSEVISADKSNSIKIRCRKCGEYQITDQLSDVIYDYYTILPGVSAYLKQTRDEGSRAPLNLGTENIAKYACEGQKILSLNKKLFKK